VHLSALGSHLSETLPLQIAEKAFRKVLSVFTREEAPLDWATTQSNLGDALSLLGREAGSTRLGEAVAAYRAALEVQSPEQTPLDWAVTQNNLGAALLSHWRSTHASGRRWTGRVRRPTWGTRWRGWAHAKPARPD
jgi:hypothetical protein